MIEETKSSEHVHKVLRSISRMGALGFSLIPLGVHSKTPRDRGYRLADYASFDWARHVEAGGNYGVLTGNGLLVLDIDPRHGGEGSLATLEWDNGLPDLRATFPHVRTGSGGWHIYLKVPPDLRLQWHLPHYPGIHVQGSGRFVVGPGSVHPETGKVYRKSGDWGLSIPEAPPALLKAVARPAPAERKGAGGQITPEMLATLLAVLDPEDFREYGEWLSLAMACHAVTDGDGRAEWLDWCARDPQYGDAAREVNGDHWDSFNAAKRGGITAATLFRAVSDAGHPELVAQADRTSAEGDFAGLIGEEEPEAPAPAGKSSRFREATYAESLEWEEPKWTIPGLIPHGGFVQNYGKQKTGKTFIALDMALCVATGRSYHGRPVERGRVTYVAAEGSRTRFRDRVTAWCRCNRVDPAELSGWFYFLNRPVDFTLPAEVKELSTALRDGIERTLIVVDTVAKNSGGADEDTKGMKLFVAGANALRFATKAAVIVLHHEGKTAALKGRGSTVLPGDVDLSLRSVRVAPNRVKLQVDEARDTESGGEMVFEFVRVIISEDITEQGVALRLVGEGRTSEPKNARERILVAIAEAGIIRSAEDLVDDTVRGMGRTNVFQAVAKLKEDGLLLEGDALELSEKGEAAALALGAVPPALEPDEE